MRNFIVRTALAGSLMVALVLAARAQQRPLPDPGKALTGTLTDVNRRILEMAEDFPAEKYGFKATPEVRSFSEVIVHAMSGTVYAAKAGRGENVEWTELDPKAYRDKAAVVAALKKANADCDTTLKATTPARFAQSPAPWLAVIEHSAEHYGQLVTYYRLNGLVPPASRPKK